MRFCAQDGNPKERRDPRGAGRCAGAVPRSQSNLRPRTRWQAQPGKEAVGGVAGRVTRVPEGRPASGVIC